MEVGLTFRTLAFNRYRTVVSKSCLAHSCPRTRDDTLRIHEFLSLKYYANHKQLTIFFLQPKVLKIYARNISNCNWIFFKKKKEKRKKTVN